MATTTFERLDYGSADGSQWGGASTDKLAFYGTTPVTRYSTALVASTFTVTTAITSNAAGLASAAAMSTFVGQVSAVIAMLNRYGLTSSS